MEEINFTAHDDYGMKAGGILASMQKFQTYFGLQLAYNLFGASKSLSRSLQAKDLSIQEAVSAVNLAKGFYKRQRTEQTFNICYNKTVHNAESLQIGSPVLPQYKRLPKQLDQGTKPHEFEAPRDYFRQQYFEACDLLLGELDDRFDQKSVLSSVMALENTLLNSANGVNYEELAILEESCYKDDFDFTKLKCHLALLADTVKLAIPYIKKVTSIRTICDAMNSQSVYKSMLPEVYKLLRLYLTIPITTATSERTFSAVRHVLTYKRATMTQKRLNNCLLTYVHKDLTDTLDMTEIAKEFIVNEERRKYFGSFTSC